MKRRHVTGRLAQTRFWKRGHHAGLDTRVLRNVLILGIRVQIVTASNNSVYATAFVCRDPGYGGDSAEFRNEASNGVALGMAIEGAFLAALHECHRQHRAEEVIHKCFRDDGTDIDEMTRFAHAHGVETDPALMTEQACAAWLRGWQTVDWQFRDMIREERSANGETKRTTVGAGERSRAPDLGET